MDKARFSRLKAGIINADVVIASYVVGDQKEIVIIKGKRIVENVAVSSEFELEICIIPCDTRFEAMTLLRLFKDL